MVQKHTFRKTLQANINTVSSTYYSMLNVDELFYPIAPDSPVISVGDTRGMTSGIILIDTTVLVYRESAVSFSGATRSTVALSLFPVHLYDGYDGYMVSRQAVSTNIPCSPTWEILWYFNGRNGRSLMNDDSTTGVLANEIEIAIIQSDASMHRYFILSEFNLFETTT